MAGCHTLLHLCASVRICGSHFSARKFCAFRAFCGSHFSVIRVCICGNLHSACEFRGRLQFLDAEASDDAEDESMSVGVLFEVVHACLAPVAEVADAPRGVQRTEVEREHLS